MNHTPLLSKSKYMNGLQCLKLLWYGYNRKDEIPEVDAAQQAIFDTGHQVGELAQRLYPLGMKLNRDIGFKAHLRQSFDALQFRRPLFEAGFTYNSAYCLVDMLVPAENDSWDVIEVKSSTSVKEEHIRDVAFQRYVYEGAGIKIRNCYVMYINNQYVKKGAINISELFVKEDVTEQTDEYNAGIEGEVSMMLEAVSREMPDIKIGAHCTTPYGCPLEPVCWSFLPEKDDISTLYRIGKRAFEFIDRGVLSIADIPEDEELNDKQAIQLECLRTGKPYINKEAIRRFIKDIKYPVYFLDFETINPAIPVYDDSSPYQRIPFQYSLYILEHEGAIPESHAFLAPDDKDPRPEILRRLKALLGDKGTIIAYNAAFEKDCLASASTLLKEYSSWYENIEKRFVDLLVPFRNFDYYSPKQSGSASLKNVLPALTGISYDGLAITDGGMASAEFYRVIFNKTISENERDRVFSSLNTYSDQDTKGMLDILEALGKLSQ